MIKSETPPSANMVKFVLIFSMVLMGACGLVYEYVLSVLGNYLMGTSYEEIFIIIGIMMFAMGLGSMVQRTVTKNLFEKFLLLEISLGLIGGFSASLIYMLFAVTPAFKVVLYTFALAIGGLIGMEIPLLIRINQEYSKSLRINLSEILCMDYIGALIGALVFTYFLLARFSLSQISFLLGLTNVIIGFISLFIFRFFLIKFRSLLVFALVSLFVLSAGLFKSQDWSKWAEQKYYADPVIVSKTTPFQHLTLTKGPRELNLFINGHLQFSSTDEFIYHELLVIPPLILSPRNSKILILGGGDGLALREVLKFPGVKQVDLVDLDPSVISLACTQEDLVSLNRAAFFDARVKVKGTGSVSLGDKVEITTKNMRPEFTLDNRSNSLAQVNLYLIDADLFVREVSETYDRIIIDLPDPSSLELAKLYSVDFYSSLIKRLDPEGFLSLQATSPYSSKHAFLCIGSTLAKAGFKTLPYHENVPSFGEWGWFLCWKSDLSKQEIFSRFSSLPEIPVSTRYLTKEILPAVFTFPKYMLKTDKEMDTNSKMNPVLWTYYRKDWHQGPG